MDSNNNVKVVNNGGVGFIGLLQIAFIVLKLCGVIDWNWCIVLIPIWASLCFLVVCFVIALSLMLIAKIIGGRAT